jgi:hypothetical protein
VLPPSLTPKKTNPPLLFYIVLLGVTQPAFFNGFKKFPLFPPAPTHYIWVTGDL